MAVFNTDPNAQTQKAGPRNYYQPMLRDGTLVAVRPVVEKITEFRPIPEIAEDGSIMPTIRRLTPAGPDISNMRPENIMMNVGVQTKHTGLCRASDVESDKDIDCVFPGIFIRARAAQKRNTLPEHLKPIVDSLLKPDANNRTSMGRPQTMGLIQGIGITINDETPAKPQARQCFFLPTTATMSVVDLLVKCHNDGIDVFSPDKGYTIKLSFLPKNLLQGRPVPVFQASLGRQLPVNATKYWTPWEQALKLHTYDDQIKMAVRCYGAEVVKFCYPSDYERIYGAVAAPVAPRPAAPAPQAPQAQRAAVSAPTPRAAPQVAIDLNDVDESGAVPEATVLEENVGNASPAAATSPTPTRPPGPTGLAGMSPEDMAKSFEDLL